MIPASYFFKDAYRTRFVDPDVEPCAPETKDDDNARPVFDLDEIRRHLQAALAVVERALQAHRA